MTQQSLFQYKEYITDNVYQKMSCEDQEKLIAFYRVCYHREKGSWGAELVKKNIARELNISYRLSSQLKVYIERLEPMLQTPKIVKRFGLQSYKKLPPQEKEKLSAIVKERVLDLVSKGINLQEAEKQVCEERGLTHGLVEELSIPMSSLSKIKNRNMEFKF